MAVAIAMPKLGMTMAEGTVVAWQARVGARVGKGGPLLLIESEKAEVEIEAPIDGVLRHVYVEAGAVVPCGTLLAALTETVDETFDADAFRAANERVLKAPAAAPTSARAGASVARAAGAGAAPRQAPVTPAARRRARELGIEAAKVPGSGPGGRVTVDDVEGYAARMSARVEVAPGVCLDVPASGDGRPVILLPGFGTDASAFAPQIPELAKLRRVLAVNPRGVAFSDAPESERYEIAEAAADVAGILTRHGPADIVGASMGAAIAIELALAHPESVRSLTLITPFVRATARLAAVAQAWIAAATAGPETVGALLVPWMFSEEFLAEPSRRERAARSIAQTSGRIDARVLARWAAGIAAWSGSRERDLRRIAAPTLVVAAGEDLLVPGATEVAGSIAGARLVRIDHAGHAVAIEKPAEVTRAIAEQLG